MATHLIILYQEVYEAAKKSSHSIWISEEQIEMCSEGIMKKMKQHVFLNI